MIVFISFVVLFCFLCYWFFYDIQHIKGQELIAESTSPNGEYTVYAYCNSGGATVDYSVLGVARNNKTGRTRNIYWKYHRDDANIEWISEQVVSINGIELDVNKDAYDYRHPNSR